MKTVEVAAQPPIALVDAVRHLKAHFPYRICWGAFVASDPSKTDQGADHTKRRFNRVLKQPGWVAFIV